MSTRSILVVGQPNFRQQVAAALELSPEVVGWVTQVAAAEKQLIDAPGETRLVAIGPEVDNTDAVHITEFVRRAAPTTAVVIARRDLNGELSSLVRAGARDVADLSQGQEELRSSLEGSLQWADSIRAATADASDAATSLGKIVTVFSSKGGAGKSFLATNLAAILASHHKRRVAIVDLDFGMGDVFSYFGTEPKRSMEDLFAPGGLANREVILSTGTRLDDNLTGYGTPTDPTADPVPAQGVAKILRAFQMHFDLVVVDGPAFYSEQMLAAFDAGDLVYVVASLDVVGIKHLTTAVHSLNGIGLSSDRLRVVLNRADSKVGLSPEDVKRVTGLKIDAMVPSSRLVPTSLNKGIPLVTDEPRSDVAKALGDLAGKLLRDLNVDPDGDASGPRTRRLFHK